MKNIYTPHKAAISLHSKSGYLSFYKESSPIAVSSPQILTKGTSNLKTHLSPASSVRPLAAPPSIVPTAAPAPPAHSLRTIRAGNIPRRSRYIFRVQRAHRQRRSAGTSLRASSEGRRGASFRRRRRTPKPRVRTAGRRGVDGDVNCRPRGW